MKRTRILKLSIMSASALTLIACERSQEVGIFESLEQCSNQSIFSKEECSKSERLARSEHIRVSPKYTSVTDCERDFGEDKCEMAPQRTTTGGSVFMPMMMAKDGALVDKLPSKTNKDEKDASNYKRTSGKLVVDAAGKGNEEKDTMLAQLADGEFVTFIFLDFAYSISMLSTPTPHLAIIFNLSPFSIISFVNCVELLITTISASLISKSKS